MEIKVMDALTGRLIENGFAFIAFLTIVITFVWRVISILEKRLTDIVVEIRQLVEQQRGDSNRLISTIDHHDERSQERHDKMMQFMNDHHRVVIKTAQMLGANVDKGKTS